MADDSQEVSVDTLHEKAETLLEFFQGDAPATEEEVAFARQVAADLETTDEVDEVDDELWEDVEVLVEVAKQYVDDDDEDDEITRRGPRGRDYCILCNPDGYGKRGAEGTEAIGVYKIERDEPPSGWQPVCPDCAEMVEKRGWAVVPVEGHEDHPIFQDDDAEAVTHECDDPTWRKDSHVTEAGGFDWMQCEECGIYGKRHGLGGTIEIVGHEKP